MQKKAKLFWKIVNRLHRKPADEYWDAPGRKYENERPNSIHWINYKRFQLIPNNFCFQDPRQFLFWTTKQKCWQVIRFTWKLRSLSIDIQASWKVTNDDPVSRKSLSPQKKEESLKKSKNCHIFEARWKVYESSLAAKWGNKQRKKRRKLFWKSKNWNFKCFSKMKFFSGIDEVTDQLLVFHFSESCVLQTQTHQNGFIYYSSMVHYLDEYKMSISCCNTFFLVKFSVFAFTRLFEFIGTHLLGCSLNSWMKSMFAIFLNTIYALVYTTTYKKARKQKPEPKLPRFSVMFARLML